ncbi:MAG: fatty acid desaturase [Balneolales bacterium]|nr:fatty acid desaturase [Balneolales bacterium]
MGFIQSTEPEPHVARRREILAKYPQIKSLMGRDPKTALYIILLVLFQIGMAWFVSQQSVWVMLASVLLIGAFANHASFVLVHDAIHNLVFKNAALNQIFAILANLPSAAPSAVSFKTYHLKHHAHQGVEEMDADLPRKWEIWLFNRGFWGKALWLNMYPLIIIFRPLDIRSFSTPFDWTFVNFVVVLGFDALILYFFGFQAFAYLLLSSFFGLGLHPVGARWIQEHFVMKEDQETYSYYGPLNKIAFNVGYHNEHHDFAGIPWSRLPKVREMAPEYYNTLEYHTSWSKLLWRFLTDPNITLESRIERETRFGLRKPKVA